MSTNSAPPLLGDKAAARSAYVLDDEPEIGALVAAVLGASGFSTRKFTAPAPFFKEFDAAVPGLVVLDLALGQSDAIEIIRRLESLKYKGNILLISGRDEATLAETAAIGERHGMIMLAPLHKPFRASDIRARLAGLYVEPRPDTAQSAPDARKPKRGAVQVTEALRKNWLELWYQPKIDLTSLSVCGAEGLLRARHPELGVVGAENILPPAGDAAYAPLSRFVVERAAADWTRFAEHGLPLKLAVNVPVSVITTPDFLGVIRRVLPTDRRFPGLTVEVTEDDVARDSQWMRETAIQLKLHNVDISIDRFGAASASLSRVADLQVAELKIDRNFVSNCSSDQSHQVLCRTVIHLAHGFGAAVCANGVETAADLRSLIDLGADRAQGFLFAEPMPSEQLMQKLLAGHGAFGGRAP